MTYELNVRISSGEAEATLAWDRGDRSGREEAARGKAKIDTDKLRLETVRLLQQWLSRWQVICQIGTTNKEFPVLNTFRVLGEHLYRIVFTGDLDDGFIRSLDQAKDAGERLRVMLSFAEDAAELAALPWEFLHRADDGRTSFYLATETDLLLSRFLSGRSRSTMPLAGLPLRVLFVMCVPENQDKEQADHMAQRKEILGAIRKLRSDNQDRLDVRIIEGWDVDKVRSELKIDPHVVHIVGHARHVRDAAGRMRGEIELPGADGTPQWNDSAKLVDLLTRGKTPQQRARLVILHLCETVPVDFTASFERLAPELIEAGIPAVLAMQYPMPASAATRFTSGFYGRLAAGDEIDRIVQEVRYEIYSRLDDQRMIGTPVLYMQSLGGQLVDRNAEVPGEGTIDTHQVSTLDTTQADVEIAPRLLAAVWASATDAAQAEALGAWIEQGGWSGDAARNEQQIRQHMKLDSYVKERFVMYKAMLEELRGGGHDNSG